MKNLICFQGNFSKSRFTAIWKLLTQNSFYISPFFRRPNLLFFTCFLFLHGYLVGQQANFKYTHTIQLLEVTFHDRTETVGDNFFPIKKDDGTGLYTPLGTPHWKLNQPSLDKYPIAYQSGTKSRISAKFELVCKSIPSASGKIFIRAFANDDNDVRLLNFEKKSVEIIHKGGYYELQYNKVLSSEAFERDKINYVRTFSVEWEVSFDDGTTWETLDNQWSINELYVTWKRPIPELRKNYEWNHTLFHLSCTANANSIGTEASIVSRVWNLFKFEPLSKNKQLFRRGDGEPLVYYKTLDARANNSYLLLQDGHGQCYAFSLLLIDLCRIQGIDYSSVKNEILVRPKRAPIEACAGRTLASEEVSFLVKDWQFNKNFCQAQCKSFPFTLANKDEEIQMYESDPLKYRFLYSEIEDLIGADGQNNNRPASIFSYHSLVKINNVFYDASYGRTYSSIHDLRNYISGWMYQRGPTKESDLNRDIDNDGVLRSSYFVRHISNNTTLTSFEIR